MKSLFPMNNVVIVNAVLLICFGANLSPAQYPSLPVVRQLLTDDSMASDVARSSGYSIEEVRKKLTMKAVDIDGDGQAEFILSGLICGQNCSHWIYRKNANAYELIPISDASFLDLKVLATSTKGHRDLLAHVFLNCCEGGLQTYQFDGNAYRPTICKIEKYEYTDKRGRIRKYRRPLITDCE